VEAADEALDEAADYQLVGNLVKIGNRPVYEEGYSDIWRGEWSPPGQSPIPVAVKILLDIRKRSAGETRDSTKLTKYLIREVRVWRTLHHPNVLPFFGFLTTPELCLVSPWYQHGNIIKYLQEHPNADRLRLVYDVLKGMTYLHYRNVVHDNMKPSNVLVNDQGEASVADFGFAGIKDSQETGLTTSVAYDGANVRYTAPEMLTEEGMRGSQASDVYSVAMVALEMLSGRRPYYRFRATGRIVMSIAAGGTPSLEDYEITSSDRVWPILTKCWAIESYERPQMDEVSQMFREVILVDKGSWIKFSKG